MSTTSDRPNCGAYPYLDKGSVNFGWARGNDSESALMKSEPAIDLRKTGISVVGDVPWGTHFCHFYETKQDLLDTLVPYFKAGLESKEFCLWVVSDADLITLEEAKGALAEAVPDLDRHITDENIEIVDGLEWYLEENVLNLERVTRAWDAKLKRALARGYDGLRVSGDTFWLAEKDWKDFFAYEKQVNDWITNQSMTVMCTYPLAKSGAAEVLDVVQAHQFAIARRQGEWEVIETPELIQAKAEIKKINEQLEQRVSERTNELRRANDELRKEVAERKQAEALLYAKEQEFRAIVENAPDHIIRYDRNFRRSYVNPAVARAYGLPREALIGKSIGSVIEDTELDIKEDQLNQLRQQIANVFDTGQSYAYELNWPLPTGRRYFSVRLFPELDRDGSVISVLGIARDITELKQAEDVLRRSEDHLRLVLDTTPALIHTGRPDGYLDYFNQRWLKYVGRSLEELQGWGWTASIHPDDVEGIVNEWRASLASGEPFEYEARVRQADGEYRWMLHRTVPLRDEHRNIVKWHGSSIDIEDRKQAEEALDERLRFETLLTELSAAFANLAPTEVDREIDKWLQTLAEFLGVDRATFFQLSEDGTTLYRSHSYTVPGIEPLPSPPIGLKDQFPWITDQLRQGVTVKWSRIPDDMPEEAVKEKEYAATLGVKSGLNIPVQMGGSVICAITFTSIVSYRHWPDGMVARLRLVGEIFAAAVERKRAEEALKESQRRLEEAQRIAHVGHWERDLETRRITWSNEIYRILGLPLERDSPRTEWLDVVHPEDRPRLSVAIEEVLRGGRRLDMEFRIVRPNGEVCFLHSQGDVIRDERGRPVRMFGTAQDITERKLAEDSLREALLEINRLKDQLYKENIALREEIVSASMFEEIIGTSPALQEVLVLVAKVAPTDSTVLITGETGTGKELIARAIHKRSNRAAHVFMSLNCAAIPPALIASELFGHEKGAFTGAVQQRLGRFELAEGGTLFLDEIGELPAETQIALLRVLQEHEFQRVGGTKTIRADVRVIAATNRDLHVAIDARAFRRDLFYRLNVFPIEMPSLRDRREDIPLLVEYFIQRYASKMGKKIRRIDKETLDRLASSDWPGNIRELQNVIERSVILNETETFTIDKSWLSHKPHQTSHEKPFSDNLATREKEMIEAALAESRGRVSGPAGAAAKLGIPPSTLDSKIRALRINKHRFKSL
jgi:PAS domain S-box-containing protein